MKIWKGLGRSKDGGMSWRGVMMMKRLGRSENGEKADCGEKAGEE